MKYITTCCLSLLALSSATYAQEACETYQIQRGDSLRGIAFSVYGTLDYRQIYDANRDVIGSNPNIIHVGATLKLPCLPGDEADKITAAAQTQAEEMVAEAQARIAEAEAAAAEIASQAAATAEAELAEARAAREAAEAEIRAAQEAAAEAISRAEAEIAQARADAFAAVEAATSLAAPQTAESVRERQIVLITGSDYPPYTDESLPDRGLYTKLVETAFLRADPHQSYKIQFVNDWNSHLDLLMPSLAFDATFPWARPDCENPGMLDVSDLDRCTSYNFSYPFYEVVDGYYSMIGSGFETALSYEAFAGTVICRPEGYSLSNMAKAGLTEPSITLVRPVLVAECFDALRNGDVDIVALDVQVASDAIADIDMEITIVENPNLLEIKSLNIMTHVDNPEGQAVLDTLNRGLTIMQNSGEWHEIVSTALKYQMENQ
ncbi:LysM peptidoglycan-binding domain-containing protein [Halocynthiibacter sp.]|uniref:LysM peptidoglycan-binding domain-containing protein n=1 Tax=Halocynthiibacter sp. TaxID=1979210 RepID=UPI003C517F41